MRFLIGLMLGALVGAVLTILATGNAGRALRGQLSQQGRQPADRDRAGQAAAGERPLGD